VLDKDILKVVPEKIPTTKPVLVVLGGRLNEEMLSSLYTLSRTWW
jgi:hypothetical protein